MIERIRLGLLTAGGLRCACALLLLCSAGSSLGAVQSAEEWMTAPAVEGRWVAEKDDNICGISDVKKVSSPGVVDYDELWDATPEIKKLKKEGIDPDSPEGKALRNQAKERITKACQKIRRREKLCSVWKKISHTDGKKPTDITSAVKKLF